MLKGARALARKADQALSALEADRPDSIGFEPGTGPVSSTGWEDHVWKAATILGRSLPGLLAGDAKESPGWDEVNQEIKSLSRAALLNLKRSLESTARLADPGDAGLLEISNFDSDAMDALIWYASGVLEGIIEDPGAAKEGGAFTRFAEVFVRQPPSGSVTAESQSRLHELYAELKKRHSPNQEKIGTFFSPSIELHGGL